MKRHNGNRIKFLIGITISIIFLWLAFQKVDLARMAVAFKEANYWYIVPAIMGLFFAHWLRAFRWRYFIHPIKRIKLNSLFTALLIGYMANCLVPAHLGELLRAYVIGKRTDISGSSAFATIALERIIDVFTLLLITAATLVFKPFPETVKIPREVETSGYIMFLVATLLFGFLILLKKNTGAALKIIEFMLRPVKKNFVIKIEQLLIDFTKGLLPLKHRIDYFIVFVTSLIMWVFYALVIYFGFLAFDFVTTHNLDFYAAIVVLIITTISIVVPSSPGYIGFYHALCVLSLGLYGIDRSAGLSFAFVVHAVSFFPIIVVGFILAWKEGVGLSKMTHKAEIQLT